MAESFCKKENISFAVLQPLMEETVIRLRNNSPAQFKPVPQSVMIRTRFNKHRKILNEYPAILTFMILVHRRNSKFRKGVKPFALGFSLKTDTFAAKHFMNLLESFKPITTLDI